MTTVHLVRHGEAQSYAADSGLTATGQRQAYQRGRDLADGAEPDERLRVVCATTTRAAETGEHLTRGLRDGLTKRGQRGEVDDPEPSTAWNNFQVWAPLRGPQEPTAAFGAYRAAAEAADGDETARALWVREMDRFWGVQDSGGDPIQHWLTVPMLTFEPPSAVVSRLWDGLVALTAQARHGDRLLCATHSGPMRALAAWAFGEDPGEPAKTELVTASLDEQHSSATLTYRERTETLPAPPAEVLGTWWSSSTGRLS